MNEADEHFNRLVGYQQFGNNGQVRLSPQQQQQMLNQQMNFQAGAKANSNPQLSPRQQTFPQGNPNAQTQPNQPQQHQVWEKFFDHFFFIQ